MKAATDELASARARKALCDAGAMTANEVRAELATVPSWQEELRRSIDAAEDGGWQDTATVCHGAGDPFAIAERRHVVPLGPIAASGLWFERLGCVNASELAGRQRGLLLLDSFGCSEKGPFVTFVERKSIGWNSFLSADRPWQSVADANGNPPYPYADFNAIP